MPKLGRSWTKIGPSHGEFARPAPGFFLMRDDKHVLANKKKTSLRNIVCVEMDSSEECKRTKIDSQNTLTKLPRDCIAEILCYMRRAIDWCNLLRVCWSLHESLHSKETAWGASNIAFTVSTRVLLDKNAKIPLACIRKLKIKEERISCADLYTLLDEQLQDVEDLSFEYGNLAVRIPEIASKKVKRLLLRNFRGVESDYKNAPLSNLKMLEELSIINPREIDRLPRFLGVCNLRMLTIVTCNLDTDENVYLLDKVIRRAVKHCPLEVLNVFCDSGYMPKPDAGFWKSVSGIRFGCNFFRDALEIPSCIKNEILPKDVRTQIIQYMELDDDDDSTMYLKWHANGSVKCFGICDEYGLKCGKFVYYDTARRKVCSGTWLPSGKIGKWLKFSKFTGNVIRKKKWMCQMVDVSKSYAHSGMLVEKLKYE
jgi:hypothetical protein